MLSDLKNKLFAIASSGSSSKNEEEERKMTATIRKMMAQQEKKVEAISEIHLTFGKKETDEFARETLEDQNEGRPYFRKCPKEIGKHHQIVLWIQTSTIQKQFITEIKLGHALPSHPLFINGRDYGLDPILHERMKGDQRGEPTFCLWYKKDQTSSKIIDDMAVSYTKKDESNLRKEQYQKIPTCLEEFGLATSAHLWIRCIERTSVPKTGIDLGRMQAELNDYTSMLAKAPDDPILQDMVSKARRRMQAAQAEKDVRSKCNPIDPLMYAKEFLALNRAEMNKLQAAYDKIPQSKDRHISMDDFCHYIGEKDAVLPFLGHILVLSGALRGKDRDNNNGNATCSLDFGTTGQFIACFCMLRDQETLQAIFTLHDTSGKGHIENKDFLSILTMFHPRYKGRTTRALREFDIPEDGKMSFGRFKELHSLFPHLMFPAFRIQESIQRQFMGSKWWQRKLRKINVIKEAIRKEEKAD